MIIPADSYWTKSWSLSSTSSKSCSPYSSSDISSLYLGALFDALSLRTWLCPILDPLAPLLANRQLFVGVREPSLDRRERTWRGRAIAHRQWVLPLETNIFSLLWQRLSTIGACLDRVMSFSCNSHWSNFISSPLFYDRGETFTKTELLHSHGADPWNSRMYFRKHEPHNIKKCHLSEWRRS